MTLCLEQVFYGCGKRGYAILGMSPMAQPFAVRVESLCGAVGSPSGNYGGEPFLLSMPEGDRVLMVCGQRGTPDSMGRATLFFHALIAEKASLIAAKADAFSLFGQGVFADRMPRGAIPSCAIDTMPIKDASSMFPPDGCAIGASLPCVIRSGTPVPELVRASVGERVNDLAWATFAFQPISGFDVQVLSPRVSAPRSFNEYDASGKLLRTAEVIRTSDRESTTSRPLSTHSILQPRPPKAATPPSSSRKRSAMLRFSLGANAILFILCIALIAMRKTAQPFHVHISPSSPTTNDVRVVTNRVVMTNNIPVLTPPSAEELEGIKAAVKKEVSWAFATNIPREQIESCLGSLVGHDSAKEDIREWLNSFPVNRKKTLEVSDEDRNKQN